MAIKFSRSVAMKLLTKHDVTEKEVVECFANGEGLYYRDTQEDHDTDPPTMWFMSVTNRGRLLKVCFVRRGSDVDIKTAFEPKGPKPLETYIQLAKLPACWPSEE